MDAHIEETLFSRPVQHARLLRHYPIGARVEDDEGDKGTIVGHTGLLIVVDGDAGTIPWRYARGDLRIIDGA